MGSDTYDLEITGYEEGVSIHAPAWGATFTANKNIPLVSVSIHAPAWGATFRLVRIGCESSSFNPRSRMGSDDVEDLFSPSNSRFNPRSRMGSDFRVLVESVESLVFQSTLPHGERRRFPWLIPTLRLGFNPRSRMGSDRQARIFAQKPFVSIHAPAWGATRFPGCRRSPGHVSIHAPAWGATGRDSRIIRRHHRFNPRSRMGSDERLFIFWFCESGFNPRSRMGSDTSQGKLKGNVVVFQSTLPHGERQEELTMKTYAEMFQSTLPHGERLARFYV